jgi:hypothetical protein
MCARCARCASVKPNWGVCMYLRAVVAVSEKVCKRIECGVGELKGAEFECE